MLNKLSTIIFCGFLIYITGCASTKPETNTTKAGYGTEPIPANFSLSNSSMLDDLRIYYHVQVHESNENARPDSAELVFKIQPGSDQIFLRSRSLYLTANDKSFEWPKREWIDIFHSPALRGTITSVQLGYEDLAAIAEATSVEGNLGGQSFDWPYKSREPMRQFVAYVNSVYQQ